LGQCALRLADADRERAAFGLAGFDKKFAEKCDFPDPRPPCAPL
jgi:hypothetical protein